MTDTYTRERQLTREISTKVGSSIPGTEVLAVELLGSDRFCVFIDHPRGVDHALCERVTNVLRDYLRDWSVDVSSPGLERPLRTQGHFQRALGRRVQVRTAREIAGRKRFRGQLLAAGDCDIRVGVEGNEVNIPYDAIVRANLIDEGQQ